jgi:hypothetical protein
MLPISESSDAVVLGKMLPYLQVSTTIMNMLILQEVILFQNRTRLHGTANYWKRNKENDNK